MHGDPDLAIEVLAAARGTEPLIRELQAAADEGLSVLASSPFRRRDKGNVRRMAELVEPLDRAMRNTRVLVRRVAVASYHREPLPRSYALLCEDLADAADQLAEQLSRGEMAIDARGRAAGDRRRHRAGRAHRRPVRRRGARPAALDHRRPAPAHRAGRARGDRRAAPAPALTGASRCRGRRRGVGWTAMSESPQPRHHRPALPGAAHFESIVGDDDLAARSEAADRCATLLVRGARDSADEAVVERVVRLAESEGLDTLADLWAGSPADSLAGCLWRLYLLRAWVHLDPVAAAREFDEGRAAHPGPRGGRRGRRPARPRRGPPARRPGAARRGPRRLRRHAVAGRGVRPGGGRRPRPRRRPGRRPRTSPTCPPRGC